VSGNFTQTWRVACVLAGMLAVARESACRAAALDELRAFLDDVR
jgi:hypothetical protein